MVNSHCILRKTNDSILCFFLDISSSSLWMNIAIGDLQNQARSLYPGLDLGMNHWERENTDIHTNQWYNDNTDQDTIWGDCTDWSPEGSEKAGWTLNWMRTHSQNPKSNTTGPGDENQGILLANHMPSLHEPFQTYPKHHNPCWAHPHPHHLGYLQSFCICCSIFSLGKLKDIIAECYIILTIQNNNSIFC